MPYAFLTPFLICLVVNLWVFVGVWLWQLKSKNAGVIDVFWAVMLAFQACLYMFFSETSTYKKAIICALIVIWALRLAIYLWMRNVGKPEDRRYTLIRTNAKIHPQVKMLFIFLFQWALNTLLATCFYFIFNNTEVYYSLYDKAGIFLLVTATIGEAMADRQLQIFKSNPANEGKILQTGLWAYTRHPNYFFQWLAWVAIFLLSLGTVWGWLALLAPIVMYFMLTKVSGIAYTEEVMAHTKGEAYQKYIQNVPSFFPKLPKDVTRNILEKN